MLRLLIMSEVILLIVVLVVLAAVYYARMERERRRRSPVIDWEVANDELVREHLPHNRIEAIKIYRELTGVDLKTAREAVDYLIAHPDDYGLKAKKAGLTRDAGIRELLREGRYAEAINIYQDFTGLPHDQAEADIMQIEQELTLENPPAETGESDYSSYKRLT